MAEKGEVLTCEQLRVFHEKADALWKQWVSSANTNDQAEWDKAGVGRVERGWYFRVPSPGRAGGRQSVCGGPVGVPVGGSVQLGRVSDNETER